MRVNDIFYWIYERHQIYLKRAASMNRPWTDDKILQSYRFCNVYRELDSVTLWISRNWRGPFAKEQDLWFAMVIARLINWPDTLKAMGFPRGLDFDQFVGTVHRIQNRGDKAYSSAYIVSTNGNSQDKAEYLFEKVLTPLWAKRDGIRPVKGDALMNFYGRLCTNIGLGTFMAAQVVADMKYVAPLTGASDWLSFAAPGPGSKRGLNRVCDKPIDAPWGSKWHGTLLELKSQIDPLIVEHEMPTLHAQDLQNCLCEFDKYERVRLGEGRPRSSFRGV